MNELKEKYFSIFQQQYNNFKAFEPQNSRNENFEKTCSFMDQFFPEKVDEKQLENWKFELQTQYGQVIYQNTPVVFRTEEPGEWYDASAKYNRFFWVRYQQYLINSKNWPQKVIDVIDDTTDDILRSVGNPKSDQSFDYRGLVLGYVQSGKTANFTGLINKAYDEGYKLIIVLSGIHNDLRAQTQLRLEEEVVGKLNAGVGAIRKNDKTHFVHALTSVEEDVIGIQPNISYDLSGNKTLLVVKKNKDVLERLYALLENLILQANGQSIPVLIIDDEADQASIDTSDAKKGEDPKTINRLIREVITLFKQKVYVGYTATPFANLLIGIDREAEEAGHDLYPKDFLIGLPKPEDYCGPDEFFNAAENADDQRPSLIVDIGETDKQLFDEIKKKAQFNKLGEVPPKMKEAIYAFLISVSIRNLRGHKKVHNSMLIHTSRFTSVQSTLKEVIDQEFDHIINAVRFDPSSNYVKSIQALYEEEFVAKTGQWNEAMESNYDCFDWPTVYETMKETATEIKVMEINGESEDALEYHRYKENGLNVIAVGGDKLSRGLTLEGLTISYYYRNTLMYDTLMQMGRWFGYRKSYIDLCRIYTSSDIASYFEHLAVAMHELREEFDRLKNENLSPSEYAVRMLAHPKMMLTSSLKMRHAQAAYQLYRGKVQQTRLFTMDEAVFKNNMQATVKLIEKVYPDMLEMERKEKKEKTKYHVADNVPMQDIIQYLSEYQAYEGATKSSPQSMIDYIKLVNSEYGELSKWKVVVVEGISNDKAPLHSVKMGPLQLEETVARGQSISRSSLPSDRVDVKAIVASGQERFDEEKGAKEVTSPKLFIYPLNPRTAVFEKARKKVSFNDQLVPIGMAVAFPMKSEMTSQNMYMKNKSIKEKEGDQ